MAEEFDDIWNLYQIIHKDDRIKMSTSRRVRSDNNPCSSTSTESERIRITLWIQVDTVSADLSISSLALKGRVCVENDYVKVCRYSLHSLPQDRYLGPLLSLGSFHTLNVGINEKIELQKDFWPEYILELIDKSIKEGKNVPVIALIFQMGMSPGFYNKDFIEYICDRFATPSADAALRSLFLNKSKFIVVHSSHGYLSALEEILADKSSSAVLSSTSSFNVEQKALERFITMLSKSPNKAYYSYEHVRYAADLNSVKELFISSELLRTCFDVEKRKSLFSLMQDVKSQGGTVIVFSSCFGSMGQLNSLSGIAAILRFEISEESFELC
ncbi:Translation factor pelota [Mitosporidium daphniae]